MQYERISDTQIKITEERIVPSATLLIKKKEIENQISKLQEELDKINEAITK